MDVLTGHQAPPQIISVVGIGGIGKTTLAKNVYHNLGIVHHFDVRSWVTLSQEYDIKDILLQLLDRKGESSEDTSEELGEKLHKKLWGRRYLIILDDMWSTDVWDRIRFFFPDNDNRSRVVITTRITNVSSHLSSSPLEMRLLDDDESWKLFCATTFGKEECPHNLVEIGKNIVRKCRGLPLSIVVMGGHLKKASRMLEEWESIARNMIAFLDSGEDQCLTILSLSYTNLPTCLKPCFLYMGILSEDEKIGVQTLIRLWVAEGFLQPDGSRSSEEIAESYLKDLVDRNLIILALEDRWNGKMLTCKVHDLVREVCLKVGRKERFFCMLKHGEGYSRCTHEENFVGSGICLASEEHWKNSSVFKCYFNPDRHLSFRYIVCSPSPPIPSSISRCWNLQTLIIHGQEIHAPYEIWEMSWLRHLKVWARICLPTPPERHFVMQSLQTLEVVKNLKLSEDVCGRIPNIKELEIYYHHEWSKMSVLHYYPNNLCRLQKLESLRLRFDPDFNWRVFAQNLTYPRTLRELSLAFSGLHWEDLSIIGSLPHLEVFTLIAVKGKEWSPIEGEFLSLKSLRIGRCNDLVYWNAESCHFPVLESLILEFMDNLMKFPAKIGDIPSLQCVKLDRCNVGAAISAIRMLVEQEELGNEDLQLEVKYGYEKELQRAKKMVQEEGKKSNNLFLKHLTWN